MDLSPSDIRNCEFTTQMRGYAREEVDGLLEQVAAALEAVKQENLKLSMEVDSLKTQLSGLRQFEDTIKSAAIDARRNADLLIENAKQEAELLLNKAKSESEKVLGSRADQLSDLDSKISAAELTKKSYLNKLRSVITSHMELVDQLMQSEQVETDGTESEDSKECEDIEVTQSSEVDRKEMETVGTPSAPDKAIETEEANAADKIVEAEATDEATEEAGDDTPEQPEEAGDKPKEIDPELADALERYQTTQAEAEGAQASDGPTDDETPAPAPGQLIETSARADDIPQGFVVGPTGEGGSPDEIATDKFNLERKPATTDEPPKAEPAAPSTSPEDLAKELDKVVAKFEEEMDKAAKS